MKTEQTVKVPARQEHTKKVEIILCDICGKPDPKTSTYDRMTKCSLCNRDIHYGYDSIGKCSDYDDDATDYPSYYCIICYELRFQKYAEYIADIREEADKQINKIEEQIRKESLETKPNTEKEN